MSSFVPRWLLAVTMALSAADWLEWRGAGRQGNWTESGVIERIPTDGLKVKWRVPIQAGYSGPAVANGRVFLLVPLRKSVGAENV